MTPPAGRDDAAPDPGGDDLTAYLDGELDPAASRAVESLLRSDPAAGKRAAGLERVFELLDLLPQPTARADFATRTLTKLHLVALDDPTLALSRAGASAAAPVAGPARRLRPWAGLLAASALLFALGHLGGRAAPPASVAELPSDPASINRVALRLPWYVGVDDLAYLERLAELPGFRAAPPALSAPAPPPEEPAGDALRLPEVFQALDPRTQLRLRRLDADLRALDPERQKSLGRALEAHAAWLGHLPPAERARLLSAPTPAERFALVEGQLARVPWPRPLRGPAPDRAAWDRAAARWPKLAAPGKVWPFDDPALAPQVESFAADVLKADLAHKPDLGLKPGAPARELAAHGRLTREEYIDLRARHDAAHGREAHWGLYALQLYRLAQRHPALPEPLPGKPLVSNFLALPAKFVQQMRREGAKIDRAGGGRYPEYALEVAAAAELAGVPVPSEFGPCRPADFAPALHVVYDDKLRPTLTPAELAALEKLEGRWPAYPRELVRLADKHDLSLPGVTLPGPPLQWRKLYGTDF